MFNFSVTFNTGEVSSFLSVLSQKLQNPAPVSKQIAEIVKNSIDEGFEREVDPSGNPWDQLAPSTIENRSRRGLVPIKILSATGKGKRAIKVDYRGSNIQVSYGGNSTEYMQFHRKGKKIREFIPSPQMIENSPRIKLAIERYYNPTLAKFVYGELARTQNLLGL
jgi:phage gpG-like protein